MRFAFVSCQSVNEGTQNAYRRMIWEDQRAAPDNRLGFVLHLGDFIYEVVEYPDEVPHRHDVRCSTLAAYPTLVRSTTFMCRQRSRAIGRSIAPRFKIRTFRTPAHTSRSSASAITTNSRGKDGRAPSSTTVSRSLLKHCVSRPIKRGGNIFHHGCVRPRDRPGPI